MFKGVGRSKKQAKQCAAQSALRSCVQFHHQQPDLRDLAGYSPDDECRRRQGLMAAEDFSSDHVDNDVITPHPMNNFINGLSKPAEECAKQSQLENHQCLFWTRHFGYAGLKDSLKSLDFNQLFGHTEGESTTAGLSDGITKKCWSEKFGYPWRDHRLGLAAQDWSAPGEVALDCVSSTRRRWWNPVAVLSDLRPNIEYHRHHSVTSHVDRQALGPREVQCSGRHGGRCDNHGTGRGEVNYHGGRSVTVTAVVDGRRFQARGKTVKLTKRRLASDVLRTVFNFRFIGQKPDSLSKY